MALLQRRLFRLNERLERLAEEERLAAAELEVHRHLDDDARRDAAVSGNPIDREDARDTAADVARFERLVAGAAGEAAAPRGQAGPPAGPPRLAGRRPNIRASCKTPATCRAAPADRWQGETMPASPCSTGTASPSGPSTPCPPTWPRPTGGRPTPCSASPRWSSSCWATSTPRPWRWPGTPPSPPSATRPTPAYKATRKAAPDLFRQQLPLIDEVADCLRIAQFRLPGYEADDVIATVARRAAAAGWEVLVVTGDRDAFQLVGGPIKVVYTRRGISDTVLADTRWVEERYGVTPAQYPDYAALRGDTSDNLPGVPGVGEKTAARLVAEYGGLEGIYEHLAGPLAPAAGRAWRRRREQVFLNRQLTYLLEDVPVEAVPEDLRLQPWDPARVRPVFDGLAFRVSVAAAAGDRRGRRRPRPAGCSTSRWWPRSTRPAWPPRGRCWPLEPVWEGESLAGVVVAGAGRPGGLRHRGPPGGAGRGPGRPGGAQGPARRQAADPGAAGGGRRPGRPGLRHRPGRAT